MKCFRNLLIALQLFVATGSMAGGLSEGGGKGIVCRDAQGEMTRAFFLDLFEGEQIRQIYFDSSLLGDDAYKTVANILKKLEAFDPERAGRYRARLAAFPTEARILPDSHLEDVDDSFNVILPAGCEYEQAAIQAKPQFPGDPYYLIDGSIWNAFPIRDQAALVLHEIIYREALEEGQKDSIRTRYYNSLISSTEPMGLPAYMNLLTQVGFFGSFQFTIEGLGHHFTIVSSRDGWSGWGNCRDIGLDISQSIEAYPSPSDPLLGLMNAGVATHFGDGFSIETYHYFAGKYWRHVFGKEAQPDTPPIRLPGDWVACE